MASFVPLYLAYLRVEAADHPISGLRQCRQAPISANLPEVAQRPTQEMGAPARLHADQCTCRFAVNRNNCARENFLRTITSPRASRPTR